MVIIVGVGAQYTIRFAMFVMVVGVGGPILRAYGSENGGKKKGGRSPPVSLEPAPFVDALNPFAPQLKIFIGQCHWHRVTYSHPIATSTIVPMMIRVMNQCSNISANMIITFGGGGPCGPPVDYLAANQPELRA